MIIDKLPCIGFLVSDPRRFKTATDSSLLMMQTLQKKGYTIVYFESHELFYEQGSIKAFAHFVKEDFHKTYLLESEQSAVLDLQKMLAVIIRTDPPFDINYLTATYLLDIAASQGVLISNSSQSVRDCNEKIFALHFPKYLPPTIITQQNTQLKAFLREHKQIVLKPLNAMGGQDVVLVESTNLSINPLFSLMTQNESRAILAQRYLPAVKKGDKRIILVNGEAMPYTILRIPAHDDFRANLAAGGSAQMVELSEQDKALCADLKPILQARQLDLVGIDIIGDYLTEINVTSPTGLKIIKDHTGFNIAEVWAKHIDETLKNR